MMEHTCRKCGRGFKSPSSKRLYCSRRCFFASDRTRGGIVALVCEKCGKKFKSYKSNHRRFCSGSCAAKFNQTLTTHGESKTRLHDIWCGMKSRCNGTSCELSRKYYANRGITVCKQWQESFESFRDWALSHRYKPGLQLDR